MSDASFEEGREAPLRLIAEDVEDLKVISSLLQDAVFPVSEIMYDRRRRELALLVNRFRWEDQVAAETRGRQYERVRAVLMVRDVLSVASQGFDRHERDLILSLLSLSFTAVGDGAGELVLTLAGDGAIRADVECLNVALQDVTRPYRAPSGKRPDHPA